MTREEQLFEKHLQDLAQAAYRRGIPVYSDFLNLNEQNIFHGMRRTLDYVKTECSGGYAMAERQLAVFCPDASFVCPEYPIACLRITPLQEKFAEDLTHRDYLGAVLNLGIERQVLGDILVEEHQTYLFCLEKMADYICENLTRVRHTTVMAVRVEPEEFHYEPRFEEIRGSVNSVRLDKLLSLAFHGSRSGLSGLIEGGKVFVNGKLITSNGYEPKEGDIISARGLGRFTYVGTGGQSKKGREYVVLRRYI